MLRSVILFGPRSTTSACLVKVLDNLCRRLGRVGRVRIEHAPPKYAVIVNALQARIEDGTYAPGAMLPSETAFMAEFNTSRVTVVRALELLRNDGWIDSEKGRGRFVRAVKPAESRAMPAHAAALLSDEVE